jgi:type I restriction enzyme, S subunit
VSDLPEGWLETSLADVAQWGSGGTPSRTHSEYYGGSIPWIKTGELGQRVITETEETITELGLQNSSAKIFPKGSVAIAMYGATIGKTSVLGIDAATNQACAVAIPETRLATVEYLFRFLESQKAAFVEAGKGGAQPNISQGVIKEWPFPLAPLNEQKRIAEKLEALLTQATSSLEKLNRASELLKRFRQSVLAAAMSGVLTEDLRESNDTRGWTFERAADVCEKVQSGGTPKEGFIETAGVPFLKVYNISNQKVDFKYRPQFVTPEVHGGPLSKSRARPGDVLMNIVGPPLGKVAIIPNSFPEWNLNQAITLFRPSGRIVTEWIYYFLCSGISIAEIVHETRGSAGQVNISLSQCRDFIFPVPPLPEQLEIVSRVETLFALADQLETRISTARAQLERLTPALLAKAFRGELVPQDPNDEPATVLLERIREARASQPKERKPRQTKHKTHQVSSRGGGSLQAFGQGEVETPPSTDQASLFTAGGQTVKRLEDVTPDHLTRTITQRGRNELALEAKTLWQASELSIDDFYVQLGREVTGGLLRVNGDQPALVEVA